MTHQVRKEKKSKPQEEDSLVPAEHDWWAEFCKESSVHGMPYLARRDLHWTERIFWLLTIVAATYYAISSCFLQWKRFRDNPLVYEYEYIYMLRNFSLPGITICTLFPRLTNADKLIYDTWNVNPNEDIAKGDYYRSFLVTLTNVQYNNMQILEPYEKDPTLTDIDIVKLLLELHKEISPPVNKSNEPQPLVPNLTEMGLCQTNSRLTRYGNPYGKLKDMKVIPVRNGSFFSPTQIQLKPYYNYTVVQLFMHDVNEMMLPQDRRTVSVYTGIKVFYSIRVKLNTISAEDEVTHVPIAYRKCRYTNEANLKYYSVYYPSLCRMECRINRALELCKCKPFFYAAGPKNVICNINGMLCLQRRKWLDKPCDCLPLCKENSFIVTEDLGQNSGGDDYKGEGYERMIQIHVELPKMGMKRRVVFSTDQLIMSFGGAIGLFLGASFMTIYGLIYLVLYFIIVKCKSTALCKKKATVQNA
ncbi:acid-sensing ion channel 4 [Drosophila nasuta]|uniref:acid-sensing ion channel 4 n=1 Tax=Drosophila nasuta TaxID=42062 RepID=UPI00295E91E5|nr:acid-sensing ion channel 4 [Drosophila nasuta]